MDYGTHSLAANVDFSSLPRFKQLVEQVDFSHFTVSAV